jgi:hypothetical protein
MQTAREAVKEIKINQTEERLKRLCRSGSKKSQNRAGADLVRAKEGKFYMKNYKLIPKEAKTIMVERHAKDEFLLYTTSGKFKVLPFEIKED